MNLRGRHLFLIDIVTIAFAAVGAFVIRYEALWRVGPYIWRNLFFMVAVLLIRPAVYYLYRLYYRWWRYASIAEMLTIIQAVTVGTLLVSAVVFGFAAPARDGVRIFSRSVLLLDWMLNILGVGATRLVARLLQRRSALAVTLAGREKPVRRVLIMGAGDAGATILREMQNNPALGYRPIGFVDDAAAKHGAQIYGVPVLGDRQDIPHLVQQHHIDQMLIAMPTAPGSAIRGVRAICESCGIDTLTIPGLYELLEGNLSVSQIRKVQIEDLLRREPVRTDLAAVEECVRGNTVLVTGAGGSIGSELCRQLALRHPRELLLLGHGENSIFHIWRELRQRHPNLRATPLIADVRDRDRIERLMRKHRPQIIFHAAAHKHVPLMERNREEAFTTNVLGTRNVLDAAEKAGTARFVLISSDKAVNPVNIMGASKRLAELVVQHAAERTGRRFGVVRFGNVLGSRGSVVPIFEQQIASGGPVTVTHPEMTRYFMTIPEAVQLVLQAAALARGGEVFVLDMGEQIRILDLARDLISLSGLIPEDDIAIRFTGVRAGEKLYEELFGEDEHPVATAHEKILLTQGKPAKTEQDLHDGLERLLQAARREDDDAFETVLRQIIPTYCPACELEIPELQGDETSPGSAQGRPGRASTSPAHTPA